MSNFVSKPLYRKNLNLYIVDRSKGTLKENVHKSDVLSLFIESISRSKATCEDYAKYLINIIFSINSAEANNINLTKEQKNYIKYLVSNKNKSCFNPKITRGQIKLWYVLFILKHEKTPDNWDQLRCWAHRMSINVTIPNSFQTEGFWNEIKKSKYENYYSTINEMDDIITMGGTGFFSNGYGKSMFIVSMIRSLPKATPIDIEESPPLFSIDITPIHSNSDPRATPPSSILGEGKIVSYQNGDAPVVSFTLPAAVIPTAPTVNSRSIFLKKKDYVVRNSASLYHEHFLIKEKSWLTKNRDHKNFKLCSETLCILRNVISSRISHLVMLKEFPYDRILMAEFITNFAIDTITVLKDILKSQNINPAAYFKLKYPMNFEIASNLSIKDLPLSTFMILDFLKEYLPLICPSETFQATFDVLKACFHNEFLSIDINFEFTLLKFEMFNNKNDIFGPSKREDQDIDNLLLAHAKYVQYDKAFSGYAELHVLRNLHKFREFSRTLSREIHSKYNVKESHIGGDFIKADGNCMIAQFIYDYIKEEEKMVAHQESVMKIYRA